MYPRNAASPERIAVGAIYLIADGTIQTTGASVRVMPQGGAAGAGGGTLACDATSGIWHYTPTTAETNYTSFMVLVYKASCTSACASAVTTGAVGTVSGTVDTTGFAATTSQFEADDITEATADHFNGRVIVFTSDALLGQACTITDYSLATGRGHFTVSTLTEAPPNNSTFTIF